MIHAASWTSCEILGFCLAIDKSENFPEQKEDQVTFLSIAIDCLVHKCFMTFFSLPIFYDLCSRLP